MLARAQESIYQICEIYEVMKSNWITDYVFALTIHRKLNEREYITSFFGWKFETLAKYIWQVNYHCIGRAYVIH